MSRRGTCRCPAKRALPAPDIRTGSLIGRGGVAASLNYPALGNGVLPQLHRRLPLAKVRLNGSRQQASRDSTLPYVRSAPAGRDRFRSSWPTVTGAASSKRVIRGCGERPKLAAFSV